jgi:ferrochelatase
MYDARMMHQPAAPVLPGEGRLAHAQADHPPVPAARIGVILANLGTPDATDYWSMRRYLNEFL